MHVEVHGDCASCRVEGAVEETWDTDVAAGPAGAPLATRCRLCGRATDTGRETVPGRAFASARDLEGALDTWARAEGLTSARELVESSFVLDDVASIHQAIARGERVETTFDVADLLFSGGGAAGGVGPAIAPDDAPPATLRMPPPPASIRRYGGARDELFALASVAAADGEANAPDLMALERAAHARGVPPLAPAEIRVRRPGEIDPPPTLVDRERVLEEMFRMAWADGELDESELRVIRDFGRSWGIDPERVVEWTRLYSFAESSAVLRWLRRIGQMIFPER